MQESIGQRIRRLRIDAGMTQAELAKLVGYASRASINKIELGKTDISQSKIIEFSFALKVSPIALLGLTDDAVPTDETVNDSDLVILNKNTLTIAYGLESAINCGYTKKYNLTDIEMKMVDDYIKTILNKEPIMIMGLAFIEPKKGRK